MTIKELFILTACTSDFSPVNFIVSNGEELSYLKGEGLISDNAIEVRGSRLVAVILSQFERTARSIAARNGAAYPESPPRLDLLDMMMLLDLCPGSLRFLVNETRANAWRESFSSLTGHGLTQSQDVFLQDGTLIGDNIVLNHIMYGCTGVGLSTARVLAESTDHVLTKLRFRPAMAIQENDNEC